MTPEEFERVRKLMAAIARTRPRRAVAPAARRTRAATGSTSAASCRKSLATGAASRSCARSAAASGSSAGSSSSATSRARWSRTHALFSLFAHASGRQRGRAEAFAFGTRLTRVTPDLLDRDADRAVCRARRGPWCSTGAAARRIGASLAQFNAERWGRRGITRGAVVVIVSDGWEREDFDLVAREMARLARTAYALIWVNPLKGDPELPAARRWHARGAAPRRPVPVRAESL